MSSVNRDLAMECLKELSDRPFQEALWTGKIPGQQSSFSEAVEGLLTDSGLGDALNAGKTEFSGQVTKTLHELRRQLKKVDGDGGPKEVINDPAMSRARELAAAALQLLSSESK